MCLWTIENKYNTSYYIKVSHYLLLFLNFSLAENMISITDPHFIHESSNYFILKQTSITNV